MEKTILVCGRMFDGRADALLGPAEILIEGDTIAEIAETAGRPAGVRVIDLGDRTASPGFIDTHVHLCVDGLDLARQTLQSSTAKRVMVMGGCSRRRKGSQAR